MPGPCGESEEAGWLGSQTPCWCETIRASFQGGETAGSGIKIVQDRDKRGKIQGRKGKGEVGEQNGKSQKEAAIYIF